MISDEDFTALKEGDKVILNHRGLKVTVVRVGVKDSMSDRPMIRVENAPHGCPFYFQSEIKQKA